VFTIGSVQSSSLRLRRERKYDGRISSGAQFGSFRRLLGLLVNPACEGQHGIWLGQGVPGVQIEGTCEEVDECRNRVTWGRPRSRQ
jgi:hypothetical protein